MKKQQFLGLKIACLLLALVACYLGFNAHTSVTRYTAFIAITPTPLITKSSVFLEPTPLPQQVNTQHIQSPSSTPAPTPLLLKMGSKNEEVKKIQERLLALGFLNGKADGQFGEATQHAVVWFQTQHGLQADGVVGQNTYALLFSAQAMQAVATPTPSPTPTLAPVKGEDFLILVNKQVVLDQNYTPKNLVDVEQTLQSDFIKVKYKNTLADHTAILALENMLQNAVNDGISNWQISSAYRSIKEQQQIFNKTVKNFMEKDKLSQDKATQATKLTVATPGTSEHHTGLAFDITVPGKTFKFTKQSQWLAEHCWDYGFIIRYQEGKQKITGYLPEPWHIRYVGLPHSKLMHEKNLTLEEYLQLP